MSIKYTEDFKLEAVRIALSSGLPRARIASDLGVGKSTLSKWISVCRPTDMPVAPQRTRPTANGRAKSYA
jgi:transposase